MGVSLMTRARTVASLGVANVARVAAYRLRLRAGVHPVQRLARAEAVRGPFFRRTSATHATLPTRIAPRAHFGWLDVASDTPPDWHVDPLTGRRAAVTDADWWLLPDFDSHLGDIKGIWEASRMDWVVGFAQQAANGDGTRIERLNAWLCDWSEKNPPYRGQNWKCAQEASIRVMHLAVAALILGQADSPEPDLVALLTMHLERIAPTTAYAMAQDNNHGTSEAAALVIGGSWLERHGVADGARWHALGRRLLANRAERLVAADGSFSQHSVNYHRLALDTFSLVEIWRRHVEAPPFPPSFTERAVAATEWLRSLTDPDSGDAPNLGANDGANLLQLTDASYRDFRPSVQLAAALFQRRAAYPPGPWDDQLHWLGVSPEPAPLPAVRSRLFADGGYAVLRRARVMALLRYPCFRFRPAHADALHLDLWVAGENVLRDGGSFSYSADEEMHACLTGARGHNGVQLDDHEQMPRLGRFLWGDWLEPAASEPVVETGDVTTAGASYRDGHGALHARRVELRDRSLLVRDEIRDITRRAVLRWRLRAGSWRTDGRSISDGSFQLKVVADVPITRFEIVDGWESRFYFQKTRIPMLEVEVGQAGNLTTTCTWGA